MLTDLQAKRRAAIIFLLMLMRVKPRGICCRSTGKMTGALRDPGERCTTNSRRPWEEKEQEEVEEEEEEENFQLAAWAIGPATEFSANRTECQF